MTSRCWLRCAFCPKFNGEWAFGGQSLRLTRRQEPSVSQILQAVEQAQPEREIVFCGFGEPTLRLHDLLQIARSLRRDGLYVRLNTDGLVNLRLKRDVTPDLENAIDALSISLNAQNSEVYRRHCRPPDPNAYLSLLEFTERARDFVPQITLSAIDGLSGVDIAACRSIAERLGVGFRPRPLDRIG